MNTKFSQTVLDYINETDGETVNSIAKRAKIARSTFSSIIGGVIPKGETLASIIGAVGPIDWKCSLFLAFLDDIKIDAGLIRKIADVDTASEESFNSLRPRTREMLLQLGREAERDELFMKIMLSHIEIINRDVT